MKAPEKLYLPKRNKLPLEVVRGGEWYETDPQCMYGFVEYTRTDAFIEKACEWLSDNLQTIIDVDCPSKHHIESIPVLGSITQTEFLEKFREEIQYLFD